jgi:hypothetical protein
MDHYRGVTAHDTPTGGGAWVKKSGFGYEAFNFEPFRGEYFGYVRPIRSNINLSKLGASAEDEHLDGVLVVWVATHPAEGGIRVVGWYSDATVFAEFQPPPTRKKSRRLPDDNPPEFLVRAREAVLLDRDERLLEVGHGKGAMGQSNVWYPDARAAAKLIRYVQSRAHAPSSARSRKPRQMDVGRRLRIEDTAMKAAAAWFVDRGYEVKDVSTDKLGWDLEARQARSHLKVEVKGTSAAADDFAVEVTPNEYGAMTSRHRDSYRLCVVTDCEDSPVVAVFAWSRDGETWTTGDGAQQLAIEERVGARIGLATS